MGQKQYLVFLSTQTSGDFKATAWSLDRPDWTGKLKVVTQGGDCCIRLFDKGSNKLYAECPVAAYPGPAVQGRNSIALLKSQQTFQQSF